MSTLDKYRKVMQEPPKTEEYEIRVTGRGRLGMYIVYAAKLFKEKKLTKCVLKGSGPAISKVCQASEILRQRIKGLHEQCIIYSTNVVDIYEPLEEGLDKVQINKSLTVYEVILSIKEDEVDKTSVGYQAPLPEDQVSEFQLNYQGPAGGFRERGGRRGFRGGNRGGRGYRRGGYRNQRAYNDNEDESYYNRPQRGRRPPRYNDDYDNEAPRRGGRRNYDDDYQRRAPRRDDEEEYDQPRRRGGRRGGYDRGYGYERGGDRQQRGGDREERQGERGNYRGYRNYRGGDREERGERYERYERGGRRGGRGGRGDYAKENEEARPARRGRGTPKE